TGTMTPPPPPPAPNQPAGGRDITITCNPPSGSTFPIGITTNVQCNATDSAGNGNGFTLAIFCQNNAVCCQNTTSQLQGDENAVACTSEAGGEAGEALPVITDEEPPSSPPAEEEEEGEGETTDAEALLPPPPAGEEQQPPASEEEGEGGEEENEGETTEE
ncbi:MAG: HYR domain-containing protein, partial [Thermoproteota archaeon]|nr:HYR domain-containing protein [Thermoproteota archaeon]